VSTPTQPIALDDISRYLAGVCGLQAALGQSFDAGWNAPGLVDG
jgi:hypothetical protein